MVSPVSPISDVAAEQVTFRSLQLKEYEPERLPFSDRGYKKEPRTPSEWFSARFLRQAQIYGCPFLELKETSADGFSKTNPLVMNVDFFAAILGGDESLGHRVVYYEPDLEFYYYDPRDKLFKPTSAEKLQNLLRAYLIRCAEELPADVHKYSLFADFRSDKQTRAVIHRAKSILAADHTFFSAASKNERKTGPELHERIARVFAEQVLEREPGRILPLTTAYLVFCEYLKLKNMPPPKKGVFKGMFSPIIRDVFNLGLRNDIFDPATNNQTAGWKGLRAIDLEQEVPAEEGP